MHGLLDRAKVAWQAADLQGTGIWKLGQRNWLEVKKAAAQLLLFHTVAEL